MRRIMMLIAVIAVLPACASTSTLAVRSVSGDDSDTATQQGIIEALDGGLFNRLDIGQSRRSDRMLALEAEYRALEHTPAGQPVNWRSDRVELGGEVVAAQPYRVGSQDCRSYAHTVKNQTTTKTARGTACRNADGSWTPLT